jgi:hypothetical protein
MADHNGYGYATKMMLQSLSDLGYEVKPNDPTADVEIWFDQPHHWKFSDGPYKIGYHPWESTRLFTARDKAGGYIDWPAKMNQCDEIWTPSPLIADWYKTRAGIEVPVHVYQHGVDPIWKPIRRQRGNGRFRFLHVGADAARKGGKEAMQAFREGFGIRRGVDVELNLKMISSGWNIGALPGVMFLNEKMSLPDLIDLHHDNHVFVYPSWGEGFGLNPLQALATGMPTILPTAWAPYADYIHPNLAVSSRLQKSPWPTLHPGLMLQPTIADIISAMYYAMENYDELVDWHMEQVPALLAEYSWERWTQIAFSELETRLENSSKTLAR